MAGDYLTSKASVLVYGNSDGKSDRANGEVYGIDMMKQLIEDRHKREEEF